MTDFTTFSPLRAPSRRTMLKGMTAGAATLAMPSIGRAQTEGTIKVGFVSPATGPLSLFGETDGYAVEKVKEALADGIEANGKRYGVEILFRDGQSNPNKAAEVAADLILNDEVHLIVPSSTTDTVSPVADQAELYETPCLSTGALWQAVIFPRGRHHLCRRLQDLCEPVQSARLQAQGDHGRGGAAVPVGHRGPGALGRRHVIRSVVDAGFPVQINADRADQSRIGR